MSAKPVPFKVSIASAKKESNWYQYNYKGNKHYPSIVHWRPEYLPEDEQYAILLEATYMEEQ